MTERDWYQQSIDEVFAALRATRDGLTCEDAEARLRQAGYNQLEDVKALPLWRIFLLEFKNPLIYILLVAAAIAFLLGKLVDMAVILASVTINSIVGAIQQARAERAIGSLKALQAPVAVVRRDGVEQEIDARILVPGDLVLLRAGAQVPADIRLVEVVELTIDESSLTGESLPVEKTVAPMPAPYLTPGDQTNMAFMGTVITDGAGAGVVVATGRNTQFGRIASAVQAVHREPSPLEIRIGHFGRQIGLAVLALAGLVALLGLLLRETFTDIIFIAISVTVAAVPEGLPVVVTIALAIGVRRMAQRNAIIRKLAAVETLGSCTIICSDKTGTLTENQMTVQRLWVRDHVFTLSGVGYAPEGSISDPARLADLRDEVEMALRVGVLCNDTQVYREDGAWRVQGDPTEAALLVAGEKAGITRVEQLERFPWVDTIPFKSERQYMATLHRDDGGGLLCVKGSVERVLALADTCYRGCALTPAAIHQVAEGFAGDGLRVLALAVKTLPDAPEGISPEEIAAGGFAVVGLVGILDPPRAEAAEAVAHARQAGIHVAMITGDHALTAVAVARRLHIGGPDPEVLTGMQIEQFTDEELQTALPHVAVFARTAPQHKFRLVRMLRATGEVVAVTGDGVNDAPALRAADIGVAMGRAGADVAKDAADMVLADDNFATIINAVEEGRIVFENIRKVLLFLAASAMGLVVAVIVEMALGRQFLFLPSQILWMNLAITALTDVALATEPGEREILQRPPRPVRAPIITRRMWQQITLVALYRAAVTVFIFRLTLAETGSIPYAQSMAINLMVLSMLLYVLEARSMNTSLFRLHPFANRFLLAGVLVSLLAQIVFVYTGALHRVFQTTVLTPRDWGVTFLLALGVIVLVEFEKWVMRRRTGAAYRPDDTAIRLPAYLRPSHRE